MAIQAIMDPEPMQLLANAAPAPADVVWKNTYLPRSNRMLRAWSITALIVVLTIFWSALLVPFAGLLTIESIGRVSPNLEEALRSHPIAKSLVTTGLPTLLISLLNVLVPYLYNCKFFMRQKSLSALTPETGLANLQGMTSQGDVELSVIQKNFFFTFFNLFVVFTIIGVGSTAVQMWDKFRDSIKDTTTVAYILATSLKALGPFYTNLIVLQGLGLFPFRLLEFGSVALYPISLMGSKTPRGE